MDIRQRNNIKCETCCEINKLWGSFDEIGITFTDFVHIVSQRHSNYNQRQSGGHFPEKNNYYLLGSKFLIQDDLKGDDSRDPVEVFFLQLLQCPLVTRYPAY